MACIISFSPPNFPSPRVLSLFYARFGWCHRSLSSKTAMQSWLQKQGWVWVAKFAGILRFYRKAVVLISATSPPPSPAANGCRKSLTKRERKRDSFTWYIQENWRVPNLSPLLPAQLERPLRPATATGLFNFVHKSVMEEPLQALPIRNEACRVTMLSDKGFLSLRWPCRTEKLWTFACWSALCLSLFFLVSVFLALCLSFSLHFVRLCVLFRSTFFLPFFFYFFAFCIVHHFCQIEFELFEIESSIFFYYIYIQISVYSFLMNF